jgi:hypothetical protein
MKLKTRDEIGYGTRDDFPNNFYYMQIMLLSWWKIPWVIFKILCNHLMNYYFRILKIVLNTLAYGQFF